MELIEISIITVLLVETVIIVEIKGMKDDVKEDMLKEWVETFVEVKEEVLVEGDMEVDMMEVLVVVDRPNKRKETLLHDY